MNIAYSCAPDVHFWHRFILTLFLFFDPRRTTWQWVQTRRTSEHYAGIQLAWSSRHIFWVVVILLSQNFSFWHRVLKQKNHACHAPSRGKARLEEALQLFFSTSLLFLSQTVFFHELTDFIQILDLERESSVEKMQVPFPLLDAIHLHTSNLAQSISNRLTKKLPTIGSKGSIGMLCTCRMQISLHRIVS